jgi:hypothetical protein
MTQVLTNVRLFVDGRELSGQMNAIGIEYGVDALDATTYGNDTRIHAGGLKTTTMSHQGYWASADDAHIFPRIGPSAIVTVCPEAALGGSAAYFERVMHSSYGTGGTVGELLPFSFDAEAAGPLVQGSVIAPLATVTGNAAGTAYELGAVPAGKSVYAALHVTAISGGTLTVTIQSDDTSGFGSPITQVTFTGATVPGAQLLLTAGAITDTFWRANWTLTGGSATFIVSAGIL